MPLYLLSSNGVFQHGFVDETTDSLTVNFSAATHVGAELFVEYLLNDDARDVSDGGEVELRPLGSYADQMSFDVSSSVEFDGQ